MEKVLIADDHELICIGLKEYLSDEKDIEVIGMVHTAKSVLDFVYNNQVDIILLDIQFPDRGGLEIIKDILAYDPKIKILFLSGLDEKEYSIRALELGAYGFVTKLSSQDTIIMALRKIISGEKYVSSITSEKLISKIQNNKPTVLHEALSAREFLVFKKIGFGYSIKEISDQLFLSPKTISTYKSRILTKMDLTSSADIIKYVISNKLS